MPSSRWLPPEDEAAIGLGFYATGTPPIAGRLKAQPSDFIVRELSAYPSPDPTGAFTVLRIRSEDWEQHDLAQRIAARLGLPPHAISWAGTKDRRARADRLFSYRGEPPNGPIELPRVELIEAYRSRTGLSLGHHFGNEFTIRWTGLEGDESAVRGAFESTRAALDELGGFPNFFGPQRFGEVRPVTHLVGRALAHGDPEGAVETYLSFVPRGADGPGDVARREYASTHDAREALRTFPPSFRFERTLLDHLYRGHPAERALRGLSRELRTLFVHAYQSLLFNRWLSARWVRGGSLRVPDPGDRLVRVMVDGTWSGADPIPVSSDNLTECRQMVERGRAALAGPLVGYETPVDSGDPDLAAVLSTESIAPSDFRMGRTPGLASAGGWRAAMARLPPVGIGFPDAETRSEPSRAMELHFALSKGSYATVLLREFLKTGAQSA